MWNMDQQPFETEARLARMQKAYEDPEYLPKARGAIQAGEEAIIYGLFNAAHMYFAMATAICLTAQEMRIAKREAGKKDVE